MRRVKMHLVTSTAITISIAALCHQSAYAQAATDDLNANDVMATFHKYISNIIDPTMPPNHWLSLSIVGSVADADDPGHVNDIANFCPPPRPVIDIFGAVRHLDGLYLDIMNGLTGPLRPKPPEVAIASAKLTDPVSGEPTALYQRYKKYQAAYAAALTKYFEAPDDLKKKIELANVSIAEQDWKIQGGRGEINAARWIIEKNNGKFGDESMGERKVILDGFKKVGMDATDIGGLGASYRSPVSELSPIIKKWDDPAGWVSFHYTTHQFHELYDASYGGNKGFGGLSLGFMTVVGSGGGGKNTEQRITNIRDFTLDFEIKRVQIRRPWFDTEVFFQPTAWTWVKTPSTSNYPHVADGIDATGKLLPPKNSTYDNADIGCSILPIELIIARKRTITATLADSDYQKITTSGSSGGGGSFFGIFGGGSSRNWSTTNVTENNSQTAFTLTSPGVAVIGMISEALPPLPTPNVNDKWPDDAWIEGKQ